MGEPSKQLVRVMKVSNLQISLPLAEKVLVPEVGLEPT
jgi:hypothetical protein